MAKTITIPTNVGFTNSTFSLFRAIATTASPFSGKQRTQEFDNVFWQGNVSLPPINRAQASEWLSFFLNLEGTKNFFLFTDPDAKQPRGTYNGDSLTGETRINSGTNVVSAVLSFASNGTITSTTAIFDGLAVGDFVTISGAVKEDNNGTFKVTTVTSDTIIVTDGPFVTESSTSGCKARQNVKGSTALSLQASTNAATGTIKAGDYLAIYDGATTSTNPIQLVMATEDATAVVKNGKDHYSLRVQPKLRQDLNANAVGFSTSVNRSRFRLGSPVVNWDANAVSLYGFSFDFIEVV